MASIAVAVSPTMKRPLPDESHHRSDPTQKRLRVEESDDDERFQLRPKKYKCDHKGCGKAFNRPCRLEEHMRQHSGERPFVCDEPGCDKSFQRDYHLSRHKRDSHANMRDHACSYEGCDKRFATAQRLRYHEQSHEKKAQYQCIGYSPCNEQFRKKSTLQAHISEEHLGENPYKCTFNDYFTSQPCTKGFKSSHTLNQHIATYHSGPRFTCTACSSTPSTPAMTDSSVFANPSSPRTSTTSTISSAVFPTHQALQQHIKENHPYMIQSAPPKPKKEAVFACDREGCTSKFSRRSNLTSHTRSVHEKEKRFICGATDLLKSKNIGDRWDGKGCGEGFVYKSLLEQHVRTMHLGLTSTPAPNRRRAKADKDIAAAASLLGGISLDHRCPSIEPQAVCVLCKGQFPSEEEYIEHCADRHGLPDVEIQELLLESKARSGGAFWIGGLDPEDEDGDGYDKEEEHIENWFDEQETLRLHGNDPDEMQIDPQLF